MAQDHAVRLFKRRQRESGSNSSLMTYPSPQWTVLQGFIHRGHEMNHTVAGVSFLSSFLSSRLQELYYALPSQTLITRRLSHPCSENHSLSNAYPIQLQRELLLTSYLLFHCIESTSNSLMSTLLGSLSPLSNLSVSVNYIPMQPPNPFYRDRCFRTLGIMLWWIFPYKFAIQIYNPSPYDGDWIAYSPITVEMRWQTHPRSRNALLRLW
jgi:hypothetical protein